MFCYCIDANLKIHETSCQEIFSQSCIFLFLLRLDWVASTHHVLNGLKTAILLTTRSRDFIFNIFDLFWCILSLVPIGCIFHVKSQKPRFLSNTIFCWMLPALAWKLHVTKYTFTQLMKRERKWDCASIPCSLTGGIHSRVLFISFRPNPLGSQHYLIWINYSYWVLWI